MKSIYLIRHAKSSWKNLTIKDFDRSLNNRGLNDTPIIAEELKKVNFNPSITQLANYLTDNDIYYIPTCGVVKIELEIDSWNEIIQGIGFQKFFIYPKML